MFNGANSLQSTKSNAKKIDISNCNGLLYLDITTDNLILPINAKIILKNNRNIQNIINSIQKTDIPISIVEYITPNLYITSLNDCKAHV
jgi:hypothetical protein